MIWMKKNFEIRAELVSIAYIVRKIYIMSDKVSQCMTKKTMNFKITVRFDRNFMEVIETACRQHHYQKSEFVRQAIREFVEELSKGGIKNG